MYLHQFTVSELWKTVSPPTIVHSRQHYAKTHNSLEDQNSPKVVSIEVVNRYPDKFVNIQIKRARTIRYS